jgi:hypothetical protein
MRSLLMQGTHLGVPHPAKPDPTSDLTETMILPAIQVETEAEPAQTAPDLPTLPPPAPALNRKLIWRFSIAASVAIGLLILGAILGRPQPAPAVLVADVDAQWSVPAATLKPGDHIPPGPLQLDSGEAQIQLRTGVSILLKGPARIQVRSDNAAALTLGKLTASVPPEAVGFAVHTDTAQIIDRGTEFGVEVKSDDSVAVSVLRGKVEARPNDAGAPTVLVAGQAATLTATTVTLQKADAHPHFAQVLGADNSLDVCDLLCGGDGTKHQRGHAIEVTTGEAGLLSAVDYKYGDHAYHPVLTLPAVDGTFVPDGTAGPQQVDSAGHLFKFPVTLNRSFNRIWAGGPVPQLGPPFHVMPTTLGGIDYAIAPHGFVAMHSNKGLTFNLDAVRRLQPEKRLTTFRCIAGNSSSFPDIPVNMTILIDGILAGPPRSLISKSVPQGITIPIPADSHFLTITSLQGEKGMGDNFLLLGDPMLDFKSQ